jgi:DNA-directed RNA polymerase I subunit RPA1
LDNSKDPNAILGVTPPGIRQLLEKKEGIFRKHMMGKRVDYACRSVISPDPYVGTNEIGIPLAFARVLTYPTPVTEFNIVEMRKLVERGANNYPGARWVEMHGKRIDLSKMSDDRRKAVAALLLNMDGSKSMTKPAIVGRQLRHGDTMLVNRQVRNPPESAGAKNMRCLFVCV